MQFVVSLDLFDGFESNFRDVCVVDGEDKDEIQSRVRASFDSNKRPYLEGVTVETLDEWVAANKAKF